MTLLPDEQAIQQREQKATPGPWAWESVAEKSNEFAVGLAWNPATNSLIEGRIPDGYDEKRDLWVEDAIIRRTEIGANEGGQANFADADFIAHARTDIPLLLSRIETLRDENERITHQIQDCDWLPHKSSCKCEECSRERQIKAMAKDIRDLKVERGYLLFRLSAARERIAELEAAESREAALLKALGEASESLNTIGNQAMNNDEQKARVPSEDAWETECPVRADKQHCEHWYDGNPCCACGEAMDFGQALIQLREGFKVQRIGWNGKGMWISLVPGDQWGLGSGQNYDSGHISSKLLPWIGMKTAGGEFVPWLASQTDILATDWQIVD